MVGSTIDHRLTSPCHVRRRIVTRTILAVGSRPNRLERLPPQYFAGLLTRVAAAAAQAGPPVIGLGRGNPAGGPPAHVVEALGAAASPPRLHGYAPVCRLGPP